MTGRKFVSHADRIALVETDVELAGSVAKYLVQVSDSQRGAPSRSPGVELLRLSRPQSVYGIDLLHNDFRFRAAVPAEHVDEFRPQMLEVA